MGYNTIYSVEVSVREVINSMSEKDKESLAKDLDLDKIRKKLGYELTPRQIMYELRNYKVDLIKLRDEILEHFPLEDK